ncbi:hypothetical protein ACQKLP_11305 [Chitinophaga sp. NPDC101104]|uniref:hypothetical protein n=1 Tax=Chitinophaga sp. NPDC101104 TaxID=3390561 RepID=UPI003D04C4BC
MWPHFRQSLLHTVAYIDNSLEEFAPAVRRTGIVFVILGTFAGILAFLSIAFFMEKMDQLEELGQLANIGFSEGQTLGSYVMLYSSSLLAVHMFKRTVPGPGTAWSGQLPPAAKRMFLRGLLVLLIIFGLYEFLQLLNLFSDDSIYRNSLHTALLTWLKTVSLASMAIVMSFFAVMVVLKGTGQVLNAQTSSTVIAAAVLLYFWIKVVHVLVSIINAVVTTPIAALMPHEGLLNLMSAGVMVIINLFAMIPAAAIAASIAPPDADMMFDADTK